MADLVKIAEQFADIWECEIDHPKFQDTVGDIVKKVVYMMEQEQERRWIPVIEQSPEKAEWVDVLYKDPQTKRTIATVGIYREYGDSLYPGDVLPKCWDVFDFYGERIAECPYVTHWRKRQPPQEGG